ncbi:hypothetical protein PG987_013050 [Apiospora arundinis]
MEGGNSTRPGSDDNDQRWSIDHAQFGLSAEIPAAAIEVSPRSVAGRGMSISVNWADCVLNTTLAERIVADMEKWLKQLREETMNHNLRDIDSFAKDTDLRHMHSHASAQPAALSGDRKIRWADVT